MGSPESPLSFLSSRFVYELQRASPTVVMAFLQPSIVDILTLSKMAFDIAQAFTSGRKAAPAEFHEVQNQLYSLGKALDSFKSLAPDTQQQSDQVEGILEIIGNCRFTLEHLQHLVDKYMVIQEGQPQSHRKEWRAEIWRNWKKIRWTREGGDLARLQHNLGVHVNSLNLAVAVMNRHLILAFLANGSIIGFLKSADTLHSVTDEYDRAVRWAADGVETMVVLTRIVDVGLPVAEQRLAILYVSLYCMPLRKLLIDIRRSVERKIESLAVFPSMNPYTGHPVKSVVNMIWHLTSKGTWLYQESAEMILQLMSKDENLGARDDRATELTVTVDQDTDISIAEDSTTLTIAKTSCNLANESGQEELVEAVDVQMMLLDRDSTSPRSCKLSTWATTKVARRCGFVQDTANSEKRNTTIRTNDVVSLTDPCFHRALGHLMVYNYHISDATLKLVSNLERNAYRLLISNTSRSTCLSIDVSAESLKNMDRQNDAYIQIGGPCLVAETARNRANIHQHNSAATLTCADQETQRVLVMMLHSAGRDVNENMVPSIPGHGFSELEMFSEMMDDA
ncbi:hypothetical protein BO94DRAFT_592285 [Aspergillus sclerotioniger CBS 115572]|uniref:Uncharacterized protein n=1 Tax=Aspergillus sclerotioniger CBS 115572 TaxID=1450535 RepID=A0A317XD91_9EURO|nr:hypothetical protein BO94DRAFT_592285 [Aspergillus sclerotioniger CBS 115572]PWY96499.1 hypothetical protein BO94DRAFT_592285 [Aspergillus sclerotioniger CBS 115572]